jgi:putative FmdB family regulatory protein
MPIYEFRCHSCRKRVNVFFRSIAAATNDAACPECGDQALERIISRVSLRRGGGRQTSLDDGDQFSDQMDVGFGDDMLGGDAFDDDPFGLGDDADPREVANWARQMSAYAGEPLEPELDQALTKIERGADPDEVMDELEASDAISGGFDNEEV